jgi:hypothetical protein
MISKTFKAILFPWQNFSPSGKKQFMNGPSNRPRSWDVIFNKVKWQLFLFFFRHKKFLNDKIWFEFVTTCNTFKQKYQPIILVLSNKCTLLFSTIQYTYFFEDGPTCFKPYMRFIFRDICFKLH